MPVTVHPSPHGANVLLSNAERPAYDATTILQDACPDQSSNCEEILQSSFAKSGQPGTRPSHNGFVTSAISAYSGHQHLVIRPDDVWVAVLTQFSFFVNEHAEELRDKFVAHEGQKELILTYGPTTRYLFDFRIFAEDIGRLIQENVLDPELREWIMPAFTTTTRHDTVIASIVMMGTMQKYFSYTCMIMCGLPSVTLLGEKCDYERIARRLEKLCDYGEEPSEFCQLLRPIIRHFILSFEQPKSAQVVQFWQHICKEHRNGSGSDDLSGWITAFCYWSSEGKRLVRPHRSPLPEESKVPGIQTISDWSGDVLVVDGVAYPRLGDYEVGTCGGVPAGFCKVPVKIIDNGVEIKSEMVAGSVAVQLSSTGGEDDKGLVGLDTMQAQTGWWIYEKKASG